MKKKTMKQTYIKNKKKGGDIDTRNGLKYILSIGYEMETATFSKLTKTEVVEDPDDLILYNTDTARKDILTFKKLSENEDIEILDDDLISRMEETVDEAALNDRNEIDKNIIFNITSDLSTTPFIKKLAKICDEEVDKNELYIFRSLSGEEYKINFIFKDERPCETFSNVEWLFTYLKPQQSSSVVIDTFTNALTNLVRHLNDLEEIDGNFILNTRHGEFIIDNPEIRCLYHKPSTNLYYLDTHLLNRKFTLDDICFTSQMTFSCHIENVFLVMKTLIKDSYNTIPSIHEDSEYKLYVLNQIELCVDKLVESYNANEQVFKIIMNRENIKIVKKIMGYLSLMMFKLSRYYNSYLMIQKDKRKYFKNSLFFAVRHDNNIFYNELKKNLKLLFLSRLNQMHNGDDVEINKAIAVIIQRLVVQPEVLSEYFIDETTKVRKNALSPKNILEKNTARYGDPEFSLISYFHFFENPTDTSDNMTEEGKIFTNEWFLFSELDNKSARMDLNDDIVLVEFRGFQKMLSNYIFSISNDELKNLMRNGICNELGKKYSEDISALSIKIVKKFLELRKVRGGHRGKRINRTRKNVSSYKNKNENNNNNKNKNKNNYF